MPAGTAISNTATAGYLIGAAPATAASNTLTITSVAMRSPSTLELFQHAPASGSATPTVVMPAAYSTSGTATGPFAALAPPTAAGGGGAINLGAPVPLLPATQYHITEAMFIRLTDLDQNIDTLTAETVLVTLRDAATGDIEMLRLTETGPDTGTFTGHIQTGPGPAVNGSGVLNCQPDSRITVSYTDAADGTDTRSSSILVDPYGLVFNTTTGLPVNGAAITIIDASTGLPATVYGDDGVSSFPATVTSGMTATDSGGATYTFPPGGYRFPFVTPGTYQYLITPPANYRAPSVVPTPVIQALPNGPFAMVTGSRGEVFMVDPGPALHIDVPLDPTGLKLYIVKTAGKTTAAQGDFLPYRLSIENTDPASTINTIVLTDLLPPGFRYRNGSAKIGGAAAADPDVSPDGRTLSFRLGALAAGQKTTITYVAGIGAGAVPGPAKNYASAAGDMGASSNIAMASVEVREDLFRSRATIVGQLLFDGCGDPLRAPGGNETVRRDGVRVLLEDGTSSVTDKNGMFHFEAVKPGAHVVQLDSDTMPPGYEAAICGGHDRFAGRGLSQFVDLQGGALWRADFHLALLPRMRGSVGLQLTSHIPAPPQADTGSGDAAARNRLVYSVEIRNAVVPLRNVRLTVMLPQGAAYVPGTSRLGDVPLAEPLLMENTLTHRLPDIAGDWTGTVRFETAVTPPAGADSMTAQALLTVDTPDAASVRTPVAEHTRGIRVVQKRMAVPDMVLHPRFGPLSTRLLQNDRAALDKVIRKLRPLTIQHLSVVGHTDSIPITGKATKKFKDNYALSEARARAVGEYFAKGLKLTPEQVEIIAKGPDEPVATNDTFKGRSRNRRVELKVFKEVVVTFAELADAATDTGQKTAETVGLRPGVSWPPANQAAAVEANPAQTTQADGLAALLDTAEPGFALLRPGEGEHPAIPSIKIIVKHGPENRIFVRLNDKEVDPLYYDGTLKRQDNAAALSLWRGVHLEDGDNILTVSEYSKDGTKLGEVTRVIHYSGPPVAAVFVPERSVLAADGLTPPMIAVRLTDKNGHPAREGTVGEYTVDPPHLPRQREEDLQRAPLGALAADRFRYFVGADGIARIELQPSSRTGDAVVRLHLLSGMQEVRAWLKPADRDWVLVGLAEGTAGHHTLTGNLEGLAAAGIEDKLYSDGRLAFYAKGRVLGKWLMTMAYDSGREWKKEERGLHQLVDPNRYYTVYGDATAQQNDAPSSRPLYLKLEREQFYALFGDYATGMTVTELSRYNRNFNGLKSELKSDTLDVTAFASDTSQAFVKDEIRGDGTSGLFRLSRGNIVMNSETVTIETRDRYRSEVIVSSQRLSRWLDYTIDYESGTLFFKAPVPSRDENFNPVFIVADYESFDSDDTSWTFGGRIAVRPLGKTGEAGMTYVHEGAAGAESDLTGFDASIKLSEQTTARAEAAATRSRRTAGTKEGEAYLAEVLHRADRLEGKAYVREQDKDFGLGQQNGSETATRKVGLDATYRLTPAASVRGQAFRQYTLSTGAMRDMAEVQAGYAAPRYTVSTGFRFAEDDLNDGKPRTSEQVFAAARYRLTDRLGLMLGHDQSLSGENGNSDFPTRTTLGAEYRLSDAATLLAAQELTRGPAGKTAATRAGFRSSPWTGGSLNSSVEDQYTENGTRLFAVTGLKQSWALSTRWSMDAGLDRSATIRRTGQEAVAPFNTNVPPASGGEDFTAVSLGAAYKAEHWSWNGRIENRQAATEDKLGFLMGAAGEPRQGLGLSGAVQVFRTDSVTGKEQDLSDIRLGLAFRPAETRWIVLDRLDYIVEERKDARERLENWRIVNNLVLNYRLLPSTQVSFQYGAKYVSETIDAQDYSGYTDLTGLEARYDITPKWDLGARGSVLHTRALDQREYGAGVSTGYSIAQNMWISVGYNFLGFRDRDFSKADYTADGPYLKLRAKFDQLSVRDAVKRFSGN